MATVPAMMPAVRYHGPGPLRLESVPTPSIAPGGVLVEVKAAALCHTELHFVQGTLNLGAKPITMGHEAVGTIVAVHADVDRARLGERVIVYYYVGCGDCRHCRVGDEQLCGSLKAQFGFVSDGGLAAYLAAPARNCVKLPEGLSFELAAPIGCGVTTAVHAVKLASIKGGEWVVVYGCNGVGFGLVQLAKHWGARVIAIARSTAKRAKALELGADIVIDGTDASSVAVAIRGATDGEGADVIFECVGRRETMDACVGWNGALGKRGQLVMIGYTAGETHEFRLHPIPMVVFEQKIMGSVGATLEDLKTAVDLVGSGAIKTIVDSQIGLEDFQQKGLDRISNCNCVGKIVINDFRCPELCHTADVRVSSASLSAKLTDASDEPACKRSKIDVKTGTESIGDDEFVIANGWDIDANATPSTLPDRDRQRFALSPDAKYRSVDLSDKQLHHLVQGGEAWIDKSFIQSPWAVWVTPELLSPAECDQWIRRVEELSLETGDFIFKTGAKGYERMNTGARRHSATRLVEDTAFAELLQERIRAVVPTALNDGRRFRGIRNKFLVTRYVEGQYFAPHFDGCSVEEGTGCMGAFTAVLFLNDDFEGGGTHYLAGQGSEIGENVAVRPCRGCASVHRVNSVLHCGGEVLKGTKYIMQFGLMYEGATVEAARELVKPLRWGA